MLRHVGLLVIIFCPSLSAQTAQITGRVTDPMGRVVEGAAVSVKETNTTQNRTVTTSNRGYYTVPQLKPGDYSIRIDKPGFEPGGMPVITLDVNQIARLDFSLQLSGVHEQVTINAAAQSLDSEASSLGHVVQGSQLRELPLLGRNPYALGMLLPGVRTALGMNNLVTDTNNTSAVSINGGRNNMNSFLLDGAPNTSPLQNQPVVFPVADAVQEFGSSRFSVLVACCAIATSAKSRSRAPSFPQPNRSGGSGFCPFVLKSLPKLGS
jgi:Carboxypeptidase regulatory-like domain